MSRSVRNASRIAVVLIGSIASSLQAASIRGRLLQNVAGKTIPAGGVSIALVDSHGKRSFAVVSDGSGMYYFQSVAAGSYTLQIWRKPNGPPISYPITVSEPRLDVNPLNLP